MTLRHVLAVTAVVGAVGFGVEASAQTDGAPAPSSSGPPPTKVDLPESEDDADDLPSTQPPESTLTPEQARAYAAWQYQYAVWQYQYAAWLAAQQRQPKQPQRWYGWQTLLSDGLSVTAFIAGVVAANDSRRSEQVGTTIAVAGFGSFVILPPIIHLAHNQGGNAGISAGLRLGSTAVIGLAALQCSSHSRCDDGWAVLAFIAAIGYPVAVIVDAAVAYEDVSPDEEARLAPWVVPVQGGAAFGLGGAF